MEEKERKRSEQKKTGRPVKVGAAACGAALLLAAVWLLLLKGDRFDPPIIQGVAEQITAYANDDLYAVLLDGVTAVGGEDRPGQSFSVVVHMYHESNGTEQEAPECEPGVYRVVYTCEDGDGGRAEPVESRLTVLPADREGPVISGTRDITAAAGESVSYRSGVAAVDAVDGEVPFQVDASQVDLSRTGEYPAVYSAVDRRGNETRISITVTVVEAVTVDDEESGANEDIVEPAVADVTQEQLDALTDRILSKITQPGMSQREQAKAIYDYVHTHIKYVGTSDKSSWIKGAYIGFTRGRGDCYNYFACAKALLTRAGIPNVDLQRVGGATRHYWQLVDVGDGYCHFDSCPHPTGYPLYSFMLTEAEARAYTEKVSGVRQSYYVYDYAACPVTVVGTPEEERPAAPQEPEEESPAEPQPPEEPPADLQGPEAGGIDEPQLPGEEGPADPSGSEQVPDKSQQPDPEQSEVPQPESSQPEEGEENPHQEENPLPEDISQESGSTQQPESGETTKESEE